MGTFREAEAECKPPVTMIVPVLAFAHTYFERPDDDVCIGLRTVADADIIAARSQAAKYANQVHKDVTPDDGERFGPWVECYNDTLLRWVIARGTCDPNNTREPPEVWNVAPEDQVRVALTPDGVRLIIDEWEKMRISCDPTQRECLDQEVIVGIPRLLPFIEKLSAMRRNRVRRLLAFILDELASEAPLSALEDPLRSQDECNSESKSAPLPTEP